MMRNSKYLQCPQSGSIVFTINDPLLFMALQFPQSLYLSYIDPHVLVIIVNPKRLLY